MTKEDRLILDHYVRIAKLIGEMFASASCLEVLVHDLTQPNFPIVAIFNSHITGRDVGHPSSVYNTLDADFARLPDSVTNYVFIAPNGKRLLSSSLTIRNRDHVPIGALSINFDTSLFERMAAFLQAFVAAPTQDVPYAAHTALAAHNQPTRDILLNELHKVMIHNNLSLRALSRGDKKRIVEELHQSGMLQKHGMVTLLASELKITRATIYKYVRETQQP